LSQVVRTGSLGYARPGLPVVGLEYYEKGGPRPVLWALCKEWQTPSQNILQKSFAHILFVSRLDLALIIKRQGVVSSWQIYLFLDLKTLSLYE
jgi:hypothetical protein